MLVLDWRSRAIFPSLVLRSPENRETDEWTSQLLAIRGIEEVVVMSDQQVAYVKVDKQHIDDAARQQLTHLFGERGSILSIKLDKVNNRNK